MEPEAYLTLSGKLCEGSDEASQRSAVSRAYYAVYNYLHGCILGAGLSLSQDAQAHEEIYKFLHNCGMEDIQKMALDFKNFRKQRNKSDYFHLKEFISQMEAEIWHRKAEVILTRFQNMTPGERDKVVRGFHEYQEKINQNRK